MGLQKNFLAANTEQISQLRQQFFEQLKNENDSVGAVHPKDLDRIKSTDIWLSKFLEHNDLDMKKSLEMLWSTCQWRKTNNINDISEKTIHMPYIDKGLSFPRNRDIDGKVIFIFKSKMHFKDSRNMDKLIDIFIYWMERLNRQENYEPITIFFDLMGAGLSNLDLNYTKEVIRILKDYYPCAVNYILVHEMAWVLRSAFVIIKSMLPPKAVERMHLTTSKNLGEYIDEENQLECWGGKDNYTFEFKSEIIENMDTSNESILTNSNESNSSNSNGNTPSAPKKVHFANLNNKLDSPMSEPPMSNKGGGDKDGGEMLRVYPTDTILFEKSGNEFGASLYLTNRLDKTITYKVKTTSPDKFRVRPSTGQLGPFAWETITVVMLQGASLTNLNKDKFLVMCMEVPASHENTVAELWKNTSSNSAQVEQYRLKCTMDLMHVKNTNIQSTNHRAEIANNNDPQNNVAQALKILADYTEQLQKQVKFNQVLQWITLLLFLCLSIAIVYILKIEIKNSTSEYCLRKD